MIGSNTIDYKSIEDTITNDFIYHLGNVYFNIQAPPRCEYLNRDTKDNFKRRDEVKWERAKEAAARKALEYNIKTFINKIKNP